MVFNLAVKVHCRKCSFVPQSYGKHPTTPSSFLNLGNSSAFKGRSLWSSLWSLASRPIVIWFYCWRCDNGVTCAGHRLSFTLTWTQHLFKDTSAIFSGFAWVQYPGYAISQASCLFTFTVGMGFLSFGLTNTKDIKNNPLPLPLSWLCPEVSDAVEYGSEGPQSLQILTLDKRHSLGCTLMINHSIHLGSSVSGFPVFSGDSPPY